MLMILWFLAKKGLKTYRQVIDSKRLLYFLSFIILGIKSIQPIKCFLASSALIECCYSLMNLIIYVYILPWSVTFFVKCFSEVSGLILFWLKFFFITSFDSWLFFLELINKLLELVNFPYLSRDYDNYSAFLNSRWSGVKQLFPLKSYSSSILSSWVLKVAAFFIYAWESILGSMLQLSVSFNCRDNSDFFMFMSWRREVMDFCCWLMVGKKFFLA